MVPARPLVIIIDHHRSSGQMLVEIVEFDSGADYLSEGNNPRTN